MLMNPRQRTTLFFFFFLRLFFFLDLSPSHFHVNEPLTTDHTSIKTTFSLKPFPFILHANAPLTKDHPTATHKHKTFFVNHIHPVHSLPPLQVRSMIMMVFWRSGIASACSVSPKLSCQLCVNISPAVCKYLTNNVLKTFRETC